MSLPRIVLAVSLLLTTLLVAPSDNASASITHLTQDRCRSGRVALTFDDGPSPTVTPAIVRVLQDRDVPAAFFMIGTKVAAHPEVARLVADAGFTIGNHTWDHADLTDLSRREIRSELARTRWALRDAGVAPSAYVRPPYGAADDRVRAILARMGVQAAYWTVDSEDWTGLAPRQIRRRTVALVEDRGRRGSVVLHHDGVDNSSATLAGLPREIDRLRRDGYCFVPLDRADPGTF